MARVFVSNRRKINLRSQKHKQKGAIDAPFLWDKMKKIYPALSIVAPMGRHIAQGKKTSEIRSWRSTHFPLKNLLIVENQHYLTQEGDEELGYAVAMVDVESIHSWREDELDSAMASYWEEGYWLGYSQMCVQSIFRCLS